MREPDGTTTAQAVQVVPLTDMHLQPKPLIGKAAGRRIDFLNALATKLDDETTGSQGVRFEKQLDGSGLFCAADAKDGPGRLGSLCQDFTPARLFTSAERRRLLGMCGAAPRVSSNRSSKKQRRVRKQKRVKVWTGADVFDKR